MRRAIRSLRFPGRASETNRPGGGLAAHPPRASSAASPPRGSPAWLDGPGITKTRQGKTRRESKRPEEPPTPSRSPTLHASTECEWRCKHRLDRQVFVAPLGKTKYTGAPTEPEPTYPRVSELGGGIRASVHISSTKLARQGRRDPSVDPHVLRPVVELDRPALAHARDQLALRVRQADVDVLPERGEQRGQLEPQGVEPEPRQRRHEHRAADRWGLPYPGPVPTSGHCGRDQVRLVVGNEPRLVAGAQLVEDGLHGQAMLRGMGVGGVDDLDQHVGAIHLFEGGPEGID